MRPSPRTQQLLPKLSVTARLGGGLNDYSTKQIGGREDRLARADTFLLAGAQVDYDIQPWLRVGLEYLRTSRDSNFPSFRFVDDRITGRGTVPVLAPSPCPLPLEGRGGVRLTAGRPAHKLPALQVKLPMARPFLCLHRSSLPWRWCSAWGPRHSARSTRSGPATCSGSPCGGRRISPGTTRWTRTASSRFP